MKAFMVLGAAGLAALGGIIAVGSDFEQAMANVASVAGGGAESMRLLSDAAREMGENSVFSAHQAADAMYYLGSAGFDTEQIIDSLAGVMNLAGATMDDLAHTSQVVVATLSQFGLEAEESERISNVFAAAIRGSQLNMQRLGDAMTYVGPVAASLDMSLEETTGILMALHNAGFMGSMAGTALRGALTRLLNPTKRAADALAKYNLSVQDVSPETHKFSQIIDALSNAGMGASDIMTIFGQRAGPALMALLQQGGEALNDFTEEITDTTAAADMMAIQTDTVQGKWKLFTSALLEWALTIYEWIKPALKVIIDGMTELLKHVSKKLKEWKERWEETHGDLEDVVKEYWEGKIQPAVEKAMQWIDDFWKEVAGPALERDWEETWKALKTWIKNFWENELAPLVVDMFKTLAETAADMFWNQFKENFWTRCIDFCSG